MKEQTKTNYENTLMSVAGHLAILGFLVTSFVMIGGPVETIITQNHVQITEIDLSMVKVTGTESKLWNTSAPDVADLPRADFPEKKPAKNDPADEIGDDKPIETPSMLTDAPEKKPDDKKSGESDKKIEGTRDDNAPRARTVVRVNRETRSLDRTMTISVVDALRVALTRCWVIDTKHPGIEDIRAVAHLTMYKNGTVRDMWFESASRADSDPAFAYVLETIRGAVQTCQPFKMLPASEFDAWEQIQLTFYPVSGKIM